MVNGKAQQVEQCGILPTQDDGLQQQTQLIIFQQVIFSLNSTSLPYARYIGVVCSIKFDCYLANVQSFVRRYPLGLEEVA